MRKMFSAVLAAFASFAAFSADGESDQTLKVLIIGNSFSICTLAETPQVADSMGCKLDLASLYIGGCSLERHCKNADNTDPKFKPYRFDRNVCGKRTVDNSTINVTEALKMDKWDVVTIQQASHYSFKSETYYPWGDKLIDTIHKLAPTAKILVQETWSYPPWDYRLTKFELGDQLEMYWRLHDAYTTFAKKHSLEIIPTGTAAEFIPERNRLFCAPDFHFNRDGNYLQALVWVGKLFNVDVRKCEYRPAWMDAERAEEMKAAAMDAIAPTNRIRRAFRAPRYTRGNTNIIKVQPIDDAHWYWMPNDGGTSVKFMKFRREFLVNEGDGALVIDVSADERFYLTLDGEFVARGPNRSTVENWQYGTYVIDSLKPGMHVMEATVWVLGGHGPLAQMSYRGGFILKANGAYNDRLTTGLSQWKVGRLDGIRAIGQDNGVWGTGDQFEMSGNGPLARQPEKFEEAVSVRNVIWAKGPSTWGSRANGWMLFPSQLPDQTENRVVPGKAVAAAHNACDKYAYTEADTKAPEVKAFNDFLSGKTKTFVVPAHTKLQIAWDLGRYICAYPEVRLGKATGAKMSMGWVEATQRANDGLKGSEAGDRNAIVGRFLGKYGDVMITDPDRTGVFSPPWFRCGKWCRLDFETADDPLTIESIALVESRYPLEMEGEFSSPQDASMQDIRRISLRAMQMCCHEMLFDCPYYEQQMYPGDTRVQLNVLSALSRDDRMIKRAIEIYDLGTRDDGQCPFNWPTRGTQEGATYTLCYLLMYGDYVMNHNDREWLRARLPGLRKSMAGMEYYENVEGLLENLPGWQFMDWVVDWNSDGTAPGGYFGHGVNAEANLFWVLAMRSAALVERALGHELQACYWDEKCEKLKQKIVEKFWCEERGLFADTPAKTNFSEHAQALAIIGDVLPAEQVKIMFDHLISDSDLSRCTVYFSYYLFEAYFKMGRPDLFQKRLDLWRGYVATGLTTTQEAPDRIEGGKIKESRSDCHAWGAHPIWFMQTGLAGIRSAAPFFESVCIAPQPGSLTQIHAKHPHPYGFITVDLEFNNGRATGTVISPVPGTFKYGSQNLEIKAGKNTIE